MSQQGGGKGPPRAREGSTTFESSESYHDFISAIARNRSEQRRLTARCLDAVAAGNDKSADKFNKLAEKRFHRSFELVYETVRVFDTCVSNVDRDAEGYLGGCFKGDARAPCDRFGASEEAVREDVELIRR